MANYTQTELAAALQAVHDMLRRSETAQAKFAPGTSQHTLQKNRIQALRIASALLQQASHTPATYTTAELERAKPPLASLLRKSEKAQQKLSPGTWQHTMLENNLRALHIASSLLAQALAAAVAPAPQTIQTHPCTQPKPAGTSQHPK